MALFTLNLTGVLHGCNDGTADPGFADDMYSPKEDSRLTAETADGFYGQNDISVTDAAPSELDADEASRDMSPGQTDLATPPNIDMDPPDGAIPVYSLDDRLTFAHLQGLGTHNSYHIASPIPIAAWQYTHLPLDEQLGSQGVRQFELDVRFNRNDGTFNVVHFPIADELTTCPLFTDCAEALKGWSDSHRGHHPILVLVEVKTGIDDGPPEALLEALEQRLGSVWPRERLVTPDLVQGDHPNLRDALSADGWPTLGRLRGRALFVLHTGGTLRDLYTEGLTTTAGRLMFPDAYGNTELAVAAYHSMNDPISGHGRIQAVVRAGHLVRTRSDSDSIEANAQDYSRYTAALESGAHFISTDYPVPSTPDTYGVTIPGGTPSRCNPLTAPADCESSDIEEPNRLQ